MVVEVGVGAGLQSHPQLGNGGVAHQVDVLVLDGPPEPLDEDVAQGLPLCAGRRGNSAFPAPMCYAPWPNSARVLQLSQS